MTIKVYNENRLTRQPFFKMLIDYLFSHEDVKLREIHRDFPDVANLDRQLDIFIAAGLVKRQEKRYMLALPVLSDDLLTDEKAAQATHNQYTQPFFVLKESTLAETLDYSYRFQSLANHTNAVILNFCSTYDRKSETLANYFYKVAEGLELSELETEIYQLMGDVDIEYALKYMTTFLLKFLKKEVVKNRSDIFVMVLEKYGVIEKISEQEYRCLLNFSQQEIPEVTFETAEDFVLAQIQQQNAIAPFISLGE
ncbi:DUF1803 domain-containing protein [Lactococcus nasutitermitis]|uniref:DUF1803 domain-containing protein n=1 Tax=Lactococcus nasutitermitis TaxID=1652957 RepID=A0ABV9JAF5_9LACT|nr:DUF1803 domain-containing protein [Lactococcus nasutitermitis]